MWVGSGRSASTDNAYVRADKVSVSSEVGGRIVAVYVKENQQVKAGDLLYRIDAEPYEIAIAQANAQIAQAQVDIATLRQTYAANTSSIAAARDVETYAQQIGRAQVRTPVTNAPLGCRLLHEKNKNTI